MVEKKRPDWFFTQLNIFVKYLGEFYMSLFKLEAKLSSIWTNHKKRRIFYKKAKLVNIRE